MSAIDSFKKVTANPFQKEALLPLYIRLRVYAYLSTEELLLKACTLCSFDRDEVPNSSQATDNRSGDFSVKEDATKFYLSAKKFKSITENDYIFGLISEVNI